LDLIEFTEKTIAIQDLIATHFDKKYLISIKNEYYEGHTFEEQKQFVFTNHKNGFLKSKPQISVRFLCGMSPYVKSHSHKYFFSKVENYKKTPLFLLIPFYFKDPDPKGEFLIAFRSQCEFQIVFNFKTKKYKFFAEQYLDCLEFRSIERKIKEILNKSLGFESTQLQQDLKGFPFVQESTIKKSKKKIISAIENTIQKMIVGDCYLANITQNYSIQNSKYLFDPKCFLIQWFLQKPAFGFLLLHSDVQVSSYSPERFLIRYDDKIATEPIKGTERLSDVPSLWMNTKEIYEHTMVVDLLRHDLNAICQPGSVTVKEAFFIKRCYSMFQMQSTIFGVLSLKTTLLDIMTALLPGGSVTGTPKKNVYKIINQYESSSRGYYTGIAGVLETNQNFDFSLLIRTCFHGRLGVYTGVGAGITTLSCPEEEFEEFCLKLRSFLSIRTSPVSSTS